MQDLLSISHGFHKMVMWKLGLLLDSQGKTAANVLFFIFTWSDGCNPLRSGIHQSPMAMCATRTNPWWSHRSISMCGYSHTGRYAPFRGFSNPLLQRLGSISNSHQVKALVLMYRAKSKSFGGPVPAHEIVFPQKKNTGINNRDYLFLKSQLQLSGIYQCIAYLFI